MRRWQRFAYGLGVALAAAVFVGSSEWWMALLAGMLLSWGAAGWEGTEPQ